MNAPEAVATAETKKATQPGTEVSGAIRIARVVCIFFMIFVHVNPGTAEFTSAAGIRVFDIMRFFIVDSLGRASVALLSVVAGYLAVYSLRRENYRVYVGKKTRSLLIPLVLWNLIFLVMVLAGDKVSPGYAQQALGGVASIKRVPELVLGLYGTPADAPLYFLRDVFVCALMTPVLLITLRRGTTLYVIVATTLTVVGVVTPLLETPSIFALYAMGAFIAERGHVPMPSLRLSLVALALFLALGAVLTWQDLVAKTHSPGSLSWIEAGFDAIRVPAALAFWSLSLKLGRLPVGAWITKVEPYVFIAFCSHLVISTLIWAGWQRIFGGYYASAYPIFFFAVPFIAMAGAVVGSRFFNGRAPWAFSLLNGGRSLSKPQRGQRTVTVGAGMAREGRSPVLGVTQALARPLSGIEVGVDRAR